MHIKKSRANDFKYNLLAKYVECLLSATRGPASEMISACAENDVKIGYGRILWHNINRSMLMRSKNAESIGSGLKYTWMWIYDFRHFFSKRYMLLARGSFTASQGLWVEYWVAQPRQGQSTRVPWSGRISAWDVARARVDTASLTNPIGSYPKYYDCTIGLAV